MSSAISSTRSSERPEGAERRLARLGLATGFAFAWLVEPEGPNGSLRLAGRDLPALCLIRRLTGHRCPGCGMTRGLVYLFRLKAQDGMKANLFSPFVLALLIWAALGRPGRIVSRARCAASSFPPAIG